MRILGFDFSLTKSKPTETRGQYENDFLSGKWEELGGTPSKSGVVVTQDSAMNLSAIYSAVSVYTNAIVSLPAHVIKTTNNSKTKDLLHPVSQLMVSPNSLMTNATWKQIIVPQILLWGNSYNLIEFEKGGSRRPISIMPLHPTNIQKVSIVNGTVYYEIATDDGLNMVVDQSQMLHFRGKGNNIIGQSILDHAKNSFGLGQASEDFGNKFYANGANPNGVLMSPNPLSAKAQDNLSKSWDKKHKGVNNSNRTAILEEGVKYQQITIPPNAAQFLETRRFQVEEIARWFTLPPDKIGDLTHATFSNLVQQDLNFVKHSILPFVIAIEQEMNRKLFREQEKPTMGIKFNVEGLLRGDIQTRTAAYKDLMAVGAISPNEIRAFEEMNPYEGGDSRFMQMNAAPINEDGTNQPEKEEEIEEEIIEEEPTQLT